MEHGIMTVRLVYCVRKCESDSIYMVVALERKDEEIDTNWIVCASMILKIIVFRKLRSIDQLP